MRHSQYMKKWFVKPSTWKEGDSIEWKTETVKLTVKVNDGSEKKMVLTLKASGKESEKK